MIVYGSVMCPICTNLKLICIALLNGIFSSCSGQRDCYGAEAFYTLLGNLLIKASFACYDNIRCINILEIVLE